MAKEKAPVDNWWEFGGKDGRFCLRASELEYINCADNALHFGFKSKNVWTLYYDNCAAAIDEYNKCMLALETENKITKKPHINKLCRVISKRRLRKTWLR